MQIETKTLKEWIILAVSGQFDAHNAPLILKEIDSILKKKYIKLALDLTYVEHISSAGLSVLLETLKSVKANSGKIALINPHGNVMDILEIAGFVNLFNIVNNAQELD